MLDAATEAHVQVPIIEAVRDSDGRAILEAAGEVLVDARHDARTERLAAGTAIVQTDHPLGAIAVYLCEAGSDDGLLACELIEKPAIGDEFPAWRVHAIDT